MEQIKILLIDGNNLFREGLKRLFDDTNFRIVMEADTVRHAVQKAATGKTDLILIDFDGVGDGDMKTIGDLRTVIPNSRMVVLASDVGRQRLADALEAGADGYLTKDLSANALVQSLRLVMIGEKVFPTHLAALLINGGGEEAASKAPSLNKELSQREMQILHCLVNGDSNKMIANQLKITEATVKVHLKSLLRKINASNRTQAAIWAMSNGISSSRSALSA